MANRAINDLPLASAVNDNDLFVLEQSDGSKALTGALLKSYAEAAAEEQAEAAAESAESAAESAQAAADVSTYPPITKTGSDNWWTWDKDAGEYVDSGIPAQGDDGYSPTVTITTITGGHRVSVTDAQGTSSFDVLDGDDGYSPTVSVTTITGGHRVTVTDVQGAHAFDVMDGEGAPGTASPLMDGTAAVGTSTLFSREDHCHPSDTSRVPTTRKVNDKALSSDITLSASDVGADPTGSASSVQTWVGQQGYQTSAQVQAAIDDAIGNAIGGSY